MTVVGARIVMELRGVSCLPLESAPQSKKSITCSRTFGTGTPSLSDLREAVAIYTTRIAEKLRRGRLAAGVITVPGGLAHHRRPLEHERAGGEEEGHPVRRPRPPQPHRRRDR